MEPNKKKPETKHEHFQIVKRNILKRQTGFFKSLSTRTQFFKKVFSNLGYSDEDSQDMAKQLKQDVKDTFLKEIITLELDSADTGETLIICKQKLPDVCIGSTVRHRNVNYVVSRIKENPRDGLVEYRLKRIE